MFRFKKSNIATDKELITSYKESGDNKFVGELYKRYSHLIFGVCMKYLKDEDESKDAVMQIFEKLLDDLLKYNVESFKSWIHTIAKNHCLMKLRSNQSTFIKTEEYKKDCPLVMESHPDWHPIDENVNEIYMNHLEKAVEHLNEEQKICIELFYLKGKCYQEVAENTGFSINQVKSFIQNGKRNMKIYIQDKYEQQAK